MPNTRNRINLSNLRDLIADGHHEIMCAASDANLSMIKFDEHLDKTNNAPVFMDSCVDSRLFKFQKELIAQARRLERVSEEVEEIRKNNIKVT